MNLQEVMRRVVAGFVRNKCWSCRQKASCVLSNFAKDGCERRVPYRPRGLIFIVEDLEAFLDHNHDKETAFFYHELPIVNEVEIADEELKKSLMEAVAEQVRLEQEYFAEHPDKNVKTYNTLEGYQKAVVDDYNEKRAKFLSGREGGVTP